MGFLQSRFHSTLQILTVSFLLGASAFHEGVSHTCIHGQIKSDLEILHVPSEDDNDGVGGRMLEAYSGIRIHFDYTKISGASSEFQSYIINTIVPPAKNYFEAALRVKPFPGNLTCQGFPTICSDTVTVPAIYLNEGVPADLVLFVDLTNEASSSFVAYTYVCLISSQNYRPLFGRLVYNTAFLQPSNNNVRIEADIMTTLHEITHVLGFSSVLYPYYIDPATNIRKEGHLFQKEVNKVTISVLNVEPLTTRLRDYFNCPTLEGAYLENQGNPSSAGVHFERRIFFNEYMTASSIKDSKITEFTLALLEGSGWYDVDYSLAEPITWGKNKGCAFLDGLCMNTKTKTSNFEEFCSPLTKVGCSWTGRGGGVCGASKPTTNSDLPSAFDYWGDKTAMPDQFSDNCPTYGMYVNLDCEDDALQSKAFLSSHEFYGHQGKCFMGTLAPPGTNIYPFPFCFKPTCKMQYDGSFILKVKVGNNIVTCNSQTEVSVPGLTGKLFCPDPNTFCNQITSEGFCRRGCSGRGLCLNKVCECIDGWTSHDCSRKTFVDNCERCKDGDPLRTSCYGDLCVCNPRNANCMMGLETESNTDSHNIDFMLIGFDDEGDETSSNSKDGKENINIIEPIIIISDSGSMQIFTKSGNEEIPGGIPLDIDEPAIEIKSEPEDWNKSNDVSMKENSISISGPSNKKTKRSSKRRLFTEEYSSRQKDISTNKYQEMKANVDDLANALGSVRKLLPNTIQLLKLLFSCILFFLLF